MKVGFIGLGRMGAPMARNLAAAGLDVVGSDLRPGAAAEVGIATGSPREAAASGTVVTMLPDGAVVAAVLEEIASALPPGALVIDMSTASPLEAPAHQAALPEGVRFIDAPVSGGVARAKSGSLTIIAGGDAAAVEAAAPVFAPMGAATHAGPLGAGRALKLLNNYLSAAGLAAACEATTIGKAFGLDPDLMADVFNGSTGRSNATEVKMKQQVNSGAFASGFAMGLMAKDLTLARAMADGLGGSQEGLAAMQALFAAGAAELGPEADHTEIAKLLGWSSTPE